MHDNHKLNYYFALNIIFTCNSAKCMANLEENYQPRKAHVSNQLGLITILSRKIYYVTISLYFFEVMYGFDKTIKCFTLLFNDFATCLARQSYDAVVVPGL